MQFNLRVVFLSLSFSHHPSMWTFNPSVFIWYSILHFYEIKFHIFKCKIHFYEEKCIYLLYENSKSPSRLSRLDLFPVFIFIHKKNELFLYFCAWQSELGHQGSKYIGLKRVSPHILNLCMVYNLKTIAYTEFSINMLSS